MYVCIYTYMRTYFQSIFIEQFYNDLRIKFHIMLQPCCSSYYNKIYSEIKMCDLETCFSEIQSQLKLMQQC